MSQADYRVIVNVQKATRVKDLAGGKTATYANVSGQTGLIATLHNYSYKDQFRIEQTPGGMQSGPGTIDQNLALFTFRPPFPADIGRDYKLVLAADMEQNGVVVYASGTAFNVLFVRPYRRTMQVDTEIVQ